MPLVKFVTVVIVVAGVTVWKVLTVLTLLTVLTEVTVVKEVKVVTARTIVAIVTIVAKHSNTWIMRNSDTKTIKHLDNQTLDAGRWLTCTHRHSQFLTCGHSDTQTWTIKYYRVFFFDWSYLKS